VLDSETLHQIRFSVVSFVFPVLFCSYVLSRIESLPCSFSAAYTSLSFSVPLYVAPSESVEFENTVKFGV